MTHSSSVADFFKVGHPFLDPAIICLLVTVNVTVYRVDWGALVLATVLNRSGIRKTTADAGEVRGFIGRVKLDDLIEYLLNSSGKSHIFTVGTDRASELEWRDPIA